MNDPFTGTFFQRLDSHFRPSDPLYWHNFPAKAFQIPATDFSADDISSNGMWTIAPDVVPKYNAIDTLASIQIYVDIANARLIHEQYLQRILKDALRTASYLAAGTEMYGLVNVVLPGFGSAPDRHVVVVQKADENPVMYLMPLPNEEFSAEDTAIIYVNEDGFDSAFEVWKHASRGGF